MKVKKFNFLFVLGLFVFLSPSIANAEESGKSLTLEKGYETPFEDVILKESEDEDRVIIKGTKKTDGKTEAYDVTVNTETDTYTVEPKEVTSVKEDALISPAATTYTGWVKAITDDPVGVDLTRTTLNFSWYDYGSTVGHRSSSLSTWAANPSSLGTHWYVSDRWKSSPYLYYSNQKLRVEGTGDYYNYDFLDNDKITEVDHYIKVDIQNDGTYDYVVDWGRRGESTITLDLDVEVN
ncbi:hypothetical protein [Sediminibacillus albus]|uniref:Uncharacterized protein n=1 Tax=Sediminibacillus albus TaxID=407036 RepID=A0A1G8ZZP3_9BACI|nr:hypothetical protein [Sediminibacillus albus]SDK20578.1 hypothetical protein SAMN05216243_2320 [Sediminibacillus albus]